LNEEIQGDNTPGKNDSSKERPKIQAKDYMLKPFKPPEDNQLQKYKQIRLD